MTPADRLSPDRGQAVVESLAGARVGVVGDLAADVYVAGLTERVSREAPVMIVRYERDWARPGCAANTAANVRALGAAVHLVGWLGTDEPGRALRGLLAELAIGEEGIVQTSQVQTISKTRFLAGARDTSRQQVLRLDREPTAPPPEPVRIAMRNRLQKLDDRVDAWVVSDYGYHSVDDDMKTLLREIAKRKPVVADSRYAMSSFAGMTVVKPNEEEVMAATGVNDGSIEQMSAAARVLRERLGVDAVLLTLGNRGMLLVQDGADPQWLPASGTDEIVDLTGAGDTVAAVFTTALARGASYAAAAAVANCAAGLAVMKEGPAGVTCAELREALAADEPVGERT